MTKKHYKLIGKLYAGIILINCEGQFSSDEVSDECTEDELTEIISEVIRQGDKIIKGHESMRNLSTIEQIADYVKSLYYE